MHEADNAYSIRSTRLCLISVAYNGERFILDLSLTDLSFCFLFSIWMCHFDLVVSLGVEKDNQALTRYEMLCFCPLVSF